MLSMGPLLCRWAFDNTPSLRDELLLLPLGARWILKMLGVYASVFLPLDFLFFHAILPKATETRLPKAFAVKVDQWTKHERLL